MDESEPEVVNAPPIVEPAQIVAVGDDGTKTPITTHASKLTAAQVRAIGKPCTVTVLAAFALGQNDQAGLPATGLVLEVDGADRSDWQAQIGVGIPPEFAAKVVVGATLPARYIPGTTDDEVSPDWDAMR